MTQQPQSQSVGNVLTLSRSYIETLEAIVIPSTPLRLYRKRFSNLSTSIHGKVKPIECDFNSLQKIKRAARV